jgi:hypothetical protein
LFGVKTDEPNRIDLSLSAGERSAVLSSLQSRDDHERPFEKILRERREQEGQKKAERVESHEDGIRHKEHMFSKDDE